MTDLPSDSALAEALSAAGAAHHEYEQTALKGLRDELWSGFYAAFVLGRLGDFTAASSLAATRRGRRTVELVRSRDGARGDHVPSSTSQGEACGMGVNYDYGAGQGGVFGFPRQSSPAHSPCPRNPHSRSRRASIDQVISPSPLEPAAAVR
jgi:hypothetical protein